MRTDPVNREYFIYLMRKRVITPDEFVSCRKRQGIVSMTRECPECHMGFPLRVHTRHDTWRLEQHIYCGCVDAFRVNVCVRHLVVHIHRRHRMLVQLWRKSLRGILPDTYTPIMTHAHVSDIVRRVYGKSRWDV